MRTNIHRLLVFLAAFGCLRWGELMGLEHGDIDIDAVTIRVTRAVSEVGGKLVTKEPKSVAAVRTVALSDLLREDIQAHLDRYAEPGPEGRVFVGE